MAGGSFRKNPLKKQHFRWRLNELNDKKPASGRTSQKKGKASAVPLSCSGLFEDREDHSGRNGKERSGRYKAGLDRKAVAQQVGPALLALLEFGLYLRNYGKALEDCKQVRDIFLSCIKKENNFWLLCGNWMRGGMGT